MLHCTVTLSFLYLHVVYRYAVTNFLIKPRQHRIDTTFNVQQAAIVMFPLFPARCVPLSYSQVCSFKVCSFKVFTMSETISPLSAHVLYTVRGIISLPPATIHSLTWHPFISARVDLLCWSLWAEWHLSAYDFTHKCHYLSAIFDATLHKT